MPQPNKFWIEKQVTDKHWNYHLMIQELEKRLNEVCYERED